MMVVSSSSHLKVVEEEATHFFLANAHHLIGKMYENHTNSLLYPHHHRAIEHLESLSHKSSFHTYTHTHTYMNVIGPRTLLLMKRKLRKKSETKEKNEGGVYQCLCG